jgi:hypothetical protein
MGTKKVRGRKKKRRLSTPSNGKPGNSVRMEEECELNILSPAFYMERLWMCISPSKCSISELLNDFDKIWYYV